MTRDLLSSIYQMSDSERLRLLCHLARHAPAQVHEAMVRPQAGTLHDCAITYRVHGADGTAPGAPPWGGAQGGAGGAKGGAGGAPGKTAGHPGTQAGAA